MNKDIPEPVLRSVWSGWKYHLALKSTTDGFEAGQKDTPTNMQLTIQHYHDWVKWTKEAIELLEKED